MMNLIETRNVARQSIFQLTETQRELLPLAFSSFLDSAVTASGRGTFYNSQADQECAIKAVHQDLFQIGREIYAATLALPGVTDYSRQLGVKRLLQTERRKGIFPAEFEANAIRHLVRSLPTQRMLKLFGLLRQERVNNARTRRLILGEILGSRKLEFWAVKYRAKLRLALTHAWGHRMTGILRSVLAKPPESRCAKEKHMVRQHISRFAHVQSGTEVEECVRFILGIESELTLARLVAYREAKADFSQGSILPPETLEGLRSRFHQNRSTSEVMELTRSQLTTGQKMAVQRKAKESGIEIEFDPNKYDVVKLYIYAFEMGMTDAIRDALQKKATDAAERLPLQFARVGILIDTSQSMLGHDTQARRPIATALALRDLLAATSESSTVLTSNGLQTQPYELVEPTGETSLAGGLVQLLKEEPDIVFVLSDGYENSPAGRFNDTVAAVRRLGIQTPIHQMTPVFAAETQGVRQLSDTVMAMPVSKPEAIGLGLLKALIESDLDRGIQALLGMTRIAGHLAAT